MNGHDRLCSFSDGLLHRGGRKIECLRVDVDKYGLGAAVTDGVRGRNEGERRGDYFVARTDIQRGHRQPKCVRPGGDSYPMPTFAVLGELSLEVSHCGPEDEVRAETHFPNRFTLFPLDPPTLGLNA